MTLLQEKWRAYRTPGYYTKYDYAWRLVVDLDSCTGCGACVVACQAENNLPIVGEKAFQEKRDMKWLRIERYWEGEYPDIKMRFLPMMCQHCDQAPCETVCPVAATYHNQDGLNVQVYNRCVGTRSCAAYCPYEVRYFNWFSASWEAPLEQQLNPEVSIREKGVMEKCTFCVQRIRQAKDEAKDEGRRVQEGDFTTACAQSCPSKALHFGDANDPLSAVSQLAKNPRAYHVLSELNTEPSVTYLARGKAMESAS